jgi:hypothetical protein
MKMDEDPGRSYYSIPFHVSQDCIDSYSIVAGAIAGSLSGYICYRWLTFLLKKSKEEEKYHLI